RKIFSKRSSINTSDILDRYSFNEIAYLLALVDYGFQVFIEVFVHQHRCGRPFVAEEIAHSALICLAAFSLDRFNHSQLLLDLCGSINKGNHLVERSDHLLNQLSQTYHLPSRLWLIPSQASSKPIHAGDDGAQRHHQR